MRTVQGTWLVIVLAGLLLSCSSGADSSDPTDIGGDGAAGSVSEPSDAAQPGSLEQRLGSFFDEAVLEDLATLQTGIDLFVEDQVVECMAAEGFEYQPSIAPSLTDDEVALGTFRHAANALQFFDNNSESPNDAYLSSLTTEESDAWEVANINCFVELSNEYTNPLADRANWFGMISDEASARTAANPEVIAASEQAEVCFSSLGLGTLADVDETFFNRTEEVASGFFGNSVSEEEAVEALEAIAVEEEAMSLEFWECREPYLIVETSIFNDNLRRIAAEQEDLAVLWVAEVQDEIELYRTYLNGITE